MLSEFEKIYFLCKVWFSLLDVSFTAHTQNLVYKLHLKTCRTKIYFFAQKLKIHVKTLETFETKIVGWEDVFCFLNKNDFMYS